MSGWEQPFIQPPPAPDCRPSCHFNTADGWWRHAADCPLRGPAEAARVLSKGRGAALGEVFDRACRARLEAAQRAQEAIR